MNIVANFTCEACRGSGRLFPNGGDYYDICVSFNTRAHVGDACLAILFPALQAAETTSEDPAAQAAAYSAKAADLRADADKHAKTAKILKAGVGSSKTAHESIATASCWPRTHCERLAEKLRSAAEESDAQPRREEVRAARRRG